MARRRPPERLAELARCAVELFSRARLSAHPDGGRGAPPGRLAGRPLRLRREQGSALRPRACAAPSARRWTAAALPFRAPGPGELLRHVRSAMQREIRRSSLERLPGAPGAPRRRRRAHACSSASSTTAWRATPPRSASSRPRRRTAPSSPSSTSPAGRAGLIDRVRRYLARRIREGRLRPVPDVAIAARLAIETAAWFAWHRLGDPSPQAMDDAVARDTVITVLARGLLPPGDSP